MVQCVDDFRLVWVEKKVILLEMVLQVLETIF